jgi:hypothetical protein
MIILLGHTRSPESFTIGFVCSFSAILTISTWLLYASKRLISAYDIRIKTDRNGERVDHQMSRNFSHPRAGNFCVQFKKTISGPLIFQYELLNLDNKQVKGQGPLRSYKTDEWIKVEFGHLKAGNYQLTLKNFIDGMIEFAELCPGLIIFNTALMLNS